MKRIVRMIFALLFVVSLTVTACAQENEPAAPYLWDEADLLTDEEEAELSEKLRDASHQYQAQIAVVLRSSTESDADDAVEQIYDDGGYGFGGDRAGVLLFVSMDPREYRILSNGFAARAITSGDISSISAWVQPELTAGRYADAVEIFLEECTGELEVYENGTDFEAGKMLLISLGIGLVAGLVYALILKAQLKSVRRQTRAGVYEKADSMYLTQSGDYFMYRNVTRSARQDSSSSSSSRNVGGGKF